MSLVESTGLWSAVLDEVKKKIPEGRFEMWLKDTALAEVSDDACVVNVPNRFAREYVSSRLGPVLQASFSEVTGGTKALKFQVGPGEGEPASGGGGSDQGPAQVEAGQRETQTDYHGSRKQGPLRGDMLLSRFVLGPCNQLAHAAASAFAAGETQYSPFFVQGGTGVGKTHLLQGICNAMVARDRRLNIVYMNCEAFVAEFVASVSGSRREVFQRKMIDLDVLAIDDIHRLEQKGGSQREFLHLFNELHLRNKAILLASARHPKNLSGIGEELRSRFVNGIVVPLDRPSYPTRLNILKRHLGKLAEDLSDGALQLVARSLNGNVSELVGVANRLGAEARFSRTALSQERVADILSDYVAHPLETVGLIDIEKTVCSALSVTPEQIKSNRQARTICKARQLAMYLARQVLGLSYQEIGGYFGGKNHSTVLSAERRVLKLIEDEPETKGLVKRLWDELTPGE